MNTFLPITLLVLFGSLVALVGGILCLSIKPLARFLTRYAASFASGVMLTVALVGLLPEAVHELGETAFVVALLAFLATYIFEHFVFALHHHEDDSHHAHHTSAVPLVVVGDTIHNLIDGAAIAAAYLAHPGLGFTMALSTFLHEVPHEMADFGVLLQAKWSKRRIIVVNVVSALAAFVGAYAVLATAQVLDVVGYLLAISSGLFLYLAASDFLPKPGQHVSHQKAVGIMITGVVIMLAALNALPHSHHHEEAATDHEHEEHHEHDHEDEDHHHEED